MEEKKCTKCGETKGLGEFSRKRSNRDGLQAQCKACNSEGNQRYRQINREELLEKKREYRTENQAAISEYQHDYYRANSEAVAEKRREYYWQNRESVLDRSRAYYQANRDRTAQYQQEYRQINREELLEKKREYHREHPDVARASNHRRRATKAAATVEPFTPADLRAHWEELDLWDCFYCGGDLTSTGLEVEHFYPLVPDDKDAPPGPHALINLVPSCPPCNRGAGGKHSREPWTFLLASLASRGFDLATITGLTPVGK